MLDKIKQECYNFTFTHLSKQAVQVEVERSAFNWYIRLLLYIFGTDCISPLIEQIVAECFCNCYRAGAYLVHINSNLQVEHVYDLAYNVQHLYAGKIIAIQEKHGDVWQMLQKFMPDVRLRFRQRENSNGAVLVSFLQETTTCDIIGVELSQLVPMLDIAGSNQLTKQQTEYVLLRAFLHAIEFGWNGSINVSLVSCCEEMNNEWLWSNILAYYKPDCWNVLLEFATYSKLNQGGAEHAVRVVAARLGIPLCVAEYF
jgi:hypothetical protein